MTAVNFTPDGAAVVVGLYFGQVFFYDCDGLKYITQIMCQNRRGTYKDGRKVTGLIFQKVFNNANSSSVAENVVSNSSNTQNEKNRTNKRKGNNSGATNSTDSYGTSTASAAVQLLVTTNDNNIRLIHMTDYSIGCKYKGTVNESMQIKASMSEDGRYIICGSEIGRVLIWNTLGDNASKVHEEKKGVLGMFSFLKGHKSRSERNNRFEYFYCIGKYKNAAAQSKQGKQDEETAATVALFAPSSSVLLSCSMNGLNDHEIPAQKIPSLCSSVIVTANARGNIEVFAKHFW